MDPKATPNAGTRDTGASATRFALIGAAGFVAPRHMRAIADTGNQLVAAIDLHDAVGVMDQYSPGTRFFTEIERFDRHLEKLRRDPCEQPVDYVSVCSPNYLHDAHVRLALRVKADAICEKPLVINPWNLEQLLELEEEHGKRVYTILQLRLHPVIQALRTRILAESPRQKHRVDLTYVTRRGAWYHVSWKGQEEKSGGIVMNIGIHFFDMLQWIFGPYEHVSVHRRSSSTIAGVLELAHASVHWFLSVDEQHLPGSVREAGRTAYRQLLLDGEEADFSEGFTDLHTESYRRILDGRGFGIQDAKPGIDIAYAIRNAELEPAPRNG